MLRLTERKLDAQLGATSAADQRAYAFCAVIFVVLALSLNSIIEQGARVVEMVVLAHFAVSVALAAYSARPVRFYDSGASLNAFENFLTTNSIGYIEAALIDRNHQNISDNDLKIKSSAQIFLVALIFAGAGMLMFVLDVFVSQLPSVFGEKP